MTNYHYPKPKVDMDVFVVHTNRGAVLGTTMKIIKVARKWATLTNGERFDIVTWVLDPGNHNNFGNAYPSEQEYVNELALKEAWSNFKYGISRYYSLPDILTIERIKQAAELIGIKL